MDEETLVREQPSTQAKKWYTPLVRVTTFSKVLAGVLFVVLPLLGFWLGMEWGKAQQVPTQAGYSEESCEDAGFSEDTIDAAVEEAIGGLEDPWGRDFQLVISRIESRLGCVLEKLSTDERASTSDTIDP